VILDGPVQPVLISPISGNVVSRSATNQWQLKENLMSPNANALDTELPAVAQKLRDQERDIKAPSSSPSSHKKNLQLTSPNANVLNNNPPMLIPKLRDQERVFKAPCSPPSSHKKNLPSPRLQNQVRAACSNVNENDDDDDNDVYNIPRKHLYHGAYHQSDETYDTPSRFVEHVAITYDDTYDLPPKSCGTAVEQDDTFDDTYDLPPKLCGTAVEQDDTYDIPPPLTTNTANGCRTPCGGGLVSHHGYVNTASILTAIATERDVSRIKDVQRVAAEFDAADVYDIAVSARTRSFKSSNSWYVLSFYLQDFAKSD